MKTEIQILKDMATEAGVSGVEDLFKNVYAPSEVAIEAMRRYHAQFPDEWIKDLPTDEEIEKEFPIGVFSVTPQRRYQECKQEGAKWLRDKIKSKLLPAPPKHK